MTLNSIDIVEYNEYHYELLPTWVYVFSLLDDFQDVCIYLNNQNIKVSIKYFFNSKVKIKNINLIPYSNKLIFKLLLLPFRLSLKIIGEFFKYPYLNDHLFFVKFLNNNKKTMIFNSIEPKHILMKAKYFARKNYKIFVVLHNADIIMDCEYREFLLKDNVEVFVLSKMVKNYLIRNGLTKTKIMYPIFFNYKKTEEKRGKIVFTIQGTISFNRRNYTSVLVAVEKLVMEYKLNNFIVKIVGNSNNYDGNLIKNEVYKKKLKKYFLFFDETLEYRHFYNEVHNSDFLLVLQDKTSLVYSPYFEYKCTETINVSLGFNKIPIMHEDQVKLNKFENMSLSYEDGNLVKAMKYAIEMPNHIRSNMEYLIFKKKEELLEKSLGYVKEAVNELQN